MKQYFLICLILVYQVVLSAQDSEIKVKNSTEVFGTTFTWYAENEESDKKISELIEKVKAETPAYDPDCYYSKKSPCAVKPTEATQELDKLSAEYKKETAGAFDVTAKVEKLSQRDYGGVAQGFVIDKMKQNLKGNYLIDFANDFYLSADFKGSPQLAVGLPDLDNVLYAKVIMKSGWMLGSSASPKMRVPEAYAKNKKNKDFKKIVLFAKPDFSGARLDAWSTALIVGGKKLLNQLERINAYKDQWAYVYFDNKNQATCSRSLKCKLGDELKDNYIKVEWK